MLRKTLEYSINKYLMLILLIILVFPLGVANQSYSMDKPASNITEFKAKILPGFEDLPSVYKHRPLAEQIKEYRRIYDEVYDYKAPFAERVAACKKTISESIERLHNAFGLDMERSEAKKLLFEKLSQVNEFNQDALESYMKDASVFLLDHVRPGKRESANFYANVLYWYNVDHKEKSVKKGIIPGLFGVLENAIALANFYITTDNDEKRTSKTPYIHCLKTIWVDIKNHKDNINSKLFQLYNKIIACIVDSYKEQLDIQNLEGVENEPTMHYVDLLNYYLSMSKSGYFNKYLSNDVVFILYGRPEDVPGRAISPIHFVRQLLTGKYEAYLALFDILSISKEKGSKKDPHWSTENGTEKMLNHDLEHINRQKKYIFNFNNYDYYLSYNNLIEIYNIYRKYYDNGKLNEAKILLDGLFVIVHESPGVLKSMGKGNNFNDFIKLLVSNYENFMVSGYKFDLSKGIPFRSSEIYKQEYRDWEFIIRDTYGPNHEPVHDAEGMPLYNATKESTSGDKEKAILEGYSRFWSYFENLILNYEENLKS